MNKIKITKEQKSLIDKLHMDFGRNAFQAYVSNHLYKNEDFNNPSLCEASLIFNGWYIVESEFKIGDWVRDINKDTYSKVISVVEESSKLKLIRTDRDRYISEADFTDVEKVTELWKISLLEAGRKTPEIRNGDIYVTKSGKLTCISDKTIKKTVELLLSEGAVERYIPVENQYVVL